MMGKTALRLLLVHSLYRGPERRSRRVAVGAPVRFRAGLRKREAVLADLSLRGCLLLSRHGVRVGQGIVVWIPDPATDGRSFTVRGKIVRALAGDEPGFGVDFGKVAKDIVPQLKAAVAARTDTTTVIIARTAAWGQDREHAVDRIKAYAATGAEAFMLTGVKSKADIEATHKAVPNIPITVLGPPAEVKDDARFCSDNNLKIIMLGNPTYLVAVKSIYETLKFLKEGGDAADLKGKQAAPELARQVIRTDEFEKWQKEYMK